MMFEKIKKLYAKGEIDVNGLRVAVKKLLITKEQFFELTGIEYDRYKVEEKENSNG